MFVLKLSGIQIYLKTYVIVLGVDIMQNDPSANYT